MQRRPVYPFGKWLVKRNREQTFTPSRHRIWLSALLASIVLGCAANTPMPNVQYQTWTGHVTGMITGPMTATLQIAQTDDREGFVAGKVEITVEATSGGFGKGEIKGTLTGTNDDGNLDADFKGQAFVSDGSAPIYGGLTGTLSDDSGRGKWHMRTSTAAGNLAGDWTLHRKDAQP